MITETDLNNEKNSSNILFKPKLNQENQMDIVNDNYQEEIVNTKKENFNSQFQRPMDALNTSKSFLNKSSMMTYGKMYLNTINNNLFHLYCF